MLMLLKILTLVLATLGNGPTLHAPDADFDLTAESSEPTAMAADMATGPNSDQSKPKLAPSTPPAAAIDQAPRDTKPTVFFFVGTYEVRSDDLWIIATAVVCSVSCGLLGCFLVLRRMSLLGDAISHAILPGLALAFIVTNSREPMAMLSGALVVGLLTAFLSTGLAKWGRVPEDAAMGVVFTSLFALGVILITWVARDVDLDPGCVLYGLIEFVPFDTMSIAGHEIPRSFVWLLVMLAINITLVTVFFKELKIVCFDPYLATTMGISASLVHYGLMTAVTATSVASFEAVGSILVIAMLVAPGATAHLLTDKLSPMLWLAAIISAVSGTLGYILAVWINTSVAGMIATVALGLFVLTALVAPRHGIISKQARRVLLSVRIFREDALGMLYRWHEHASGNAPDAARPLTARQIVTATRAGWLGHIVLWLLVRTALVGRGRGGGLIPTPHGLSEASQIVRGHRLWESYLVKHLATNPGAVHAAAHRTEHHLSAALQDRLAETSDGPIDPHGRPIPPRV